MLVLTPLRLMPWIRCRKLCLLFCLAQLRLASLLSVVTAGFHKLQWAWPSGPCEQHDGNCASRCAADEEVHAVRCCSTSAVNGWSNKRCADIWSESDAWGECSELTYHRASDLCATHGGRLCTKHEIDRGCVRNTGCRFNHRLLWTSDPCESVGAPDNPESDLEDAMKDAFQQSRANALEAHCGARRTLVDKRYRQTGVAMPPKTVVFPTLMKPGQEGCNGLFIAERSWKDAFLSKGFRIVQEPAVATFIVSKQRWLSMIGFGGVCPDTQMVNQIPVFKEFHDKRRMWRELREYELSGLDPSFKAADVTPATHDARHAPECIAWVRSVNAEPDTKWLRKDPTVDNGKGVRMVEDALLEKAKSAATSGQAINGCPTENIIMQQLIHPPMLLEGHKFDMRVYILIPSTQPFAAFVFPYFVTRRSGKPYELFDKGILTLMDGQSDNQLSPVQMAKRLQRSKEWLSTFYRDLKVLLSRILGAMRVRLKSLTSESMEGQFTVLGFDMLVGADGRQWLGEINVSPDLAMADNRTDWWKSVLVTMLKEVVDIQSRLLAARAERGARSGAVGQQIFPEDLQLDSIEGFELLQLEMSNGTIWEYHTGEHSEDNYLSNLAKLESSPGQLTGMPIHDEL